MLTPLRYSKAPRQSVEAAITSLSRGGNAVVTPTKVGYIIMTTDRPGLDKKFDLKERPRNKPGVVLCSSVEQVMELAGIAGQEKIIQLYRQCYKENILLGCILPWKEEAKIHIPDDGSGDLVMDDRETSCFVIRFGKPSEEIAKALWERHNKLTFASSANPSGQGNRGQLEGVGQRILDGVDLAIEADSFVRKQQPDKDEKSRFAQGVMVSMVDKMGNLRNDPLIIRNGLDLDKIALQLASIWDFWSFHQGEYH